MPYLNQPDSTLPGIVLLGAGGHCQACIDVIETEGRCRVAALVDLPANLGQKVGAYTIEYTDSDLPELLAQYPNALVTLGQIKNASLRIKLFQTLLNLNASLPSPISPLAYVSKSASLGEGSIVMHHALLNSGATVGQNCIINTKALLEHGASVGDHCHISTAAVLNGEVTIENACFIGSNATIAEGVRIGHTSLVAASAIVMRNVPPHSIVKGLWA